MTCETGVSGLSGLSGVRFRSFFQTSCILVLCASAGYKLRYWRFWAFWAFWSSFLFFFQPSCLLGFCVSADCRVAPPTPAGSEPDLQAEFPLTPAVGGIFDCVLSPRGEEKPFPPLHRIRRDRPAGPLPRRARPCRSVGRPGNPTYEQPFDPLINSLRAERTQCEAGC